MDKLYIYLRDRQSKNWMSLKLQHAELTSLRAQVQGNGETGGIIHGYGCSHCKSGLHGGGRTACPWKDKSSTDAKKGAAAFMLRMSDGSVVGADMDWRGLFPNYNGDEAFGDEWSLSLLFFLVPNNEQVFYFLQQRCLPLFGWVKEINHGVTLTRKATHYHVPDVKIREHKSLWRGHRSHDNIFFTCLFMTCMFINI